MIDTQSVTAANFESTVSITPRVALKKHHWFDFVEYLSLISVGAGSVLSVVSKQVVYTSAPLSFALLIGLVNRRRMEQVQDQKRTDSFANLDQKLSKSLKLIEQQIQNMPTPEMVGDVRQSILRHNREEIKRLNAYIDDVKRDVEHQLTIFDQQSLGEARDEITKLQIQYTELYHSITAVSASLGKLATTERVEVLDQAIATLSADTEQLQNSIQTLSEYNKHIFSSVQDQVNQLSRQLKSLPPQVDAHSIKREVAELVKVVADLVPKRDLNAVVADLQAVQQQQEVQLQVDEGFRQDLQLMHQRLQSLPNVPHLRSQLEESFAREMRTINRQLRTLSYNSPALRSKIEEVLRSELGSLQTMLADQLSASSYDLVFDWAANDPSDHAPDAHETAITGSRRVLEEALAKTQNRLILIWPWSVHTDLDTSLMRQFEIFLKRKRQLDIGWCHVTHRNDERFLSVINRRWSINPLSDDTMQNTLKRLLALKRHYPEHFRFKILGTAENFLISDASMAVLGLDARLKTQTFLREVDLKLRTTDAQVIQQLVQRFDAPNPDPADIDAYWNRAVTRYDLGDKTGAIADLNTILATNAEDSAAYNLRGIIRYECKDIAGALDDLNESITLNSSPCSVYCNRGYIRSEQGDPYGAIADFSLAIQAQPDSAIAFFYRGAASQKLEDHDGAIADYSEALAYAPNAPIVLYQRGMAYQGVGDYDEAIADLEQAAHFFTKQGSHTNAQKAIAKLAKLRQIVTQPSNEEAMPDGVMPHASPASSSREAAVSPTEAPKTQALEVGIPGIEVTGVQVSGAPASHTDLLSTELSLSDSEAIVSTSQAPTDLASSTSTWDTIANLFDTFEDNECSDANTNTEPSQDMVTLASRDPSVPPPPPQVHSFSPPANENLSNLDETNHTNSSSKKKQNAEQEDSTFAEDGTFQSGDGESLSDFCQRFTI